jgi:serine/threonine-protein kinase
MTDIPITPPEETPQDPMISTLIGRYQVLSLIGEGGMALVYRARDTQLDRDVALKLIRESAGRTPEFTRRFAREAKMVASLNHLNILKVFDFGKHNELNYLIVELMLGGSLANRIAKGRLPLADVTRILDQIAAALDYAHQAGIIHRDMKPQNILLDNQGNAFLTDFGIAKLVEDHNKTIYTSTGAIIGTPLYLSPEAWNGEVLDGRADIYALGIILYEMLAQKFPFDGQTTVRLMQQHVWEHPQPINIHRPDLPAAVQAVISRTLAKRRDDRFSSAGEMAKAFRDAIQNAPVLPQTAFVERSDLRSTNNPTVTLPPSFSPAPPPTAPPPVASASPANKLSNPLITLIGIGVALLFVIGSVFLVTRSPETPTTQPTKIALVAPTALPSHTPSLLPNLTETPIPSDTPTLTLTLTETYTFTPSQTPTETETPTPTLIPSETPDRAATALEVATQFAGFLSTSMARTIAALPTATPTFTLMPTPTFTPTFVRIGLADFNQPNARIIFEGFQNGNQTQPGLFLYPGVNNRVQPLLILPDKTQIEGITVSPDGKTVIFASDQSGIFQLYQMPLQGGTPIRLTTNAPAFQPQFSPDGKLLLFTRFSDENSDIYLLTLSTGEITALTNHPLLDQEAAWSPTGVQIFFTSNRAARPLIWQMDRDGANQQVFSTATDDRHPNISSDGGRLVYNSTYGGNRQIWWARTSDRIPIQLTTSNGENFQPEWSPDGQQILFTTTRNGSPELFIMGRFGSAQRPLLPEADKAWFVGGDTTWAVLPNP